MNETSGDSGNEKSVRDSELDSVVQWSFGLGQHSIELRSLRNGPGETIEDETELNKYEFFCPVIIQNTVRLRHKSD